MGWAGVGVRWNSVNNDITIDIRGRLVSSRSHKKRAVNVQLGGGGGAATTFRRYFFFKYHKVIRAVLICARVHSQKCQSIEQHIMQNSYRFFKMCLKL